MQCGDDAAEGEALSTARLVVGIVLGVGLMGLAAVALVARYLPIPNHRALYVVIAAPYLMLAAPVAVVVLAVGRHWVLTALAGCLTLTLIIIALPGFIGSDPPPAAAALRVMTINMQYGRADPVSLAAVADANADVVLIQELNPEAVRKLTAAGLDTPFPHRILDDRPGAEGVGLYSRHPLIETSLVPGFALAMVSARIRLSPTAPEITLVSLHLAAPWPQPIDGWCHDLATLPGTLTELAARAGTGAVLVGGDFNSTIDMKPYRALLTNGYRDAAEQAGSGRNLTYPANRRFPTVLGIDHVLTRNATAVKTSTIEIPTTDHRALLTTIMVPVP